MSAFQSIFSFCVGLTHVQIFLNAASIFEANMNSLFCLHKVLYISIRSSFVLLFKYSYCSLIDLFLINIIISSCVYRFLLMFLSVYYLFLGLLVRQILIETHGYYWITLQIDCIFYKYCLFLSCFMLLTLISSLSDSIIIYFLSHCMHLPIALLIIYPVCLFYFYFYSICDSIFLCVL